MQFYAMRSVNLFQIQRSCLKIEQIVRKMYKKADISTSLWGNCRNFCYKDVVFSRKNIIFAEYFVK